MLGEMKLIFGNVQKHSQYVDQYTIWADWHESNETENEIFCGLGVGAKNAPNI